MKYIVYDNNYPFISDNLANRKFQGSKRYPIWVGEAENEGQAIMLALQEPGPVSRNLSATLYNHSNPIPKSEGKVSPTALA